MSYSFPQFVFGFHGCDREVGEAVIAGKKRLTFSKNEYDWLGSGIYFWENAPGRALEWAKTCAANPRLTKGKVKNPFVIGAIIDLGQCLNLTDVSQMNVLREAYSHLKNTFSMNNIQLPQNKSNMRTLDCLVINTAIDLSIHNGYGNFDTVRGAYIEGNPIYPEAMIFDKTHIQICVRNPECIRGYFFPADFTPE